MHTLRIRQRVRQMSLLVSQQVILPVESEMKGWGKLRGATRGLLVGVKGCLPLAAIRTLMRSLARVDELVLLQQELVREPLMTVGVLALERLVYCKRD